MVVREGMAVRRSCRRSPASATTTQLFEAYEAAGGATIDPVAVHWWEVLGTWKWAVMCILQASVHLNGMTRSHELAAIGRRVCENEHDLLVSLDGRW